ncbi:hypothetical protein NWT09_31490 [Mycolicibacterium sp. jd]|uniref:hypothetical protein n=1 Tax=unclassified Mycolicibacterium TaxID=2636767 RepID=UPI00351B237E
MPLTPGYGETPPPHDELSALLPKIIKILGKPITRADVYDLEQGMQDQVVAAAQNPAEQQHNWDLDELPYIALLRAFDQHRDVTDLDEFVAVEQIDQPET